MKDIKPTYEELLLENEYLKKKLAISDTESSENALIEFVSQLPLAAALFNPDGNILGVNNETFDLLGYTGKDFSTL